jgi:hypothetical protein
MEDTLAEGFKGHRQLPYAHWIFLSSDLRVTCLQRFELRYLIPLQPFPEYDIRQLWASVTREQAPGPGQRKRPEVPETAAEQDETV